MLSHAFHQGVLEHFFTLGDLGKSLMYLLVTFILLLTRFLNRDWLACCATSLIEVKLVKQFLVDALHLLGLVLCLLEAISESLYLAFELFREFLKFILSSDLFLTVNSNVDG